MTGALGPPGNGERRPPQRETAPPEVNSPKKISAPSLPGGDCLSSEALWRLLRDCPPESIRWAALGYAVCAAEAAEAKARARGQAGDDIRAGGLPILLEPTYPDLNREVMRRRGDHMPCSDQCGTCTRCRLSLRYWGHTDRVGVS